MPFCSFCLSSTCPKASSASAACDARDALDHAKYLNADGSWNSSLYPMLPEVFANASPALLHGLAKTTSRTSSFVLPPLSTQATTYYNGGADLSSGAAWINSKDDTNISAAGPCCPLLRAGAPAPCWRMTSGRDEMVSGMVKLAGKRLAELRD